MNTSIPSAFLKHHRSLSEHTLDYSIKGCAIPRSLIYTLLGGGVFLPTLERQHVHDPTPSCMHRTIHLTPYLGGSIECRDGASLYRMIKSQTVAK